MRLLFCGDIVGKPGREAITSHLPRLRDELALDFVVANGENAAHGFGLTEKICHEIFDAGVDVISNGNHTFDKAEIITFMEQEPRVLRPDNYPDGTPGKGSGVFESAKGHRVLVINVMCRLFMEHVENPFASLERLVPDCPPGEAGLDFVLVDMHGEATSEKYGIGHYCDGRASLVVGTHTHVPTADVHILEQGSGYQTDAGMCGNYDSVIGMDKHSALERFLGRVPRPRLAVAEDGPGTLCGVVVETDPVSGLPTRLAPVRVGGMLQDNVPDWA